MLNESIILITGACGLLGKEFTRGFLDNNAKVILADINEAEGKKCIDELSKNYNTDNLFFHLLDITSKDSIETCIKASTEKFGKVTTLINNAYPRNKNYGKTFFDVEYKDFCENIGLNLGGSFLVAQVFSAYLKDNSIAGNIINISSIYGLIAPKFEVYDDTEMTMPVEYSVIKSGLNHLTKYMAKYLKGTGIRVNAVSPGGILNNQNDKFLGQYNQECLTKGMLDPNDIMGAVLFLASSNSEFINGQNIIVDDGFTL